MALKQANPGSARRGGTMIGDADFTRDKYGNPMIEVDDEGFIAPRPTGNAVKFRRPSQVASALDDKTTLAKWRMNWLAVLLTADPAHPGVALMNPADNWRELSALVEERLESPELTAKRERGTRLHWLFEQWDMTGSTRPIDGTEVDTVRAYAACLRRHGIRPLEAEVPVVSHEHHSAGSLDRLVEVRGEVCVVDVKTSRAAHPGAWAVQLAQYANSVRLSDGAPLGASRERGIVIHVQPDVEPVKATAYWVDLTDGAAMLAVIEQVNLWRTIGARKTNRKRSVVEPMEVVGS